MLDKELLKNLKEHPLAFPKDEFEHDLRDWKYKDVCKAGRSLETKYEDADPVWEYPLFNQGSYPMCQGYALAQMCSCIKGTPPIKEKMFSPGWIYFYRPEGYGRGSGLSTANALKTCCNVGLLKEEEFSAYGDFTKTPDIINSSNVDALKEKAKKCRMGAYVILEPDEIAEFMHKHNNAPLHISFDCYEDVYDCLKTGVYPSKPKGKRIGAHAVVLKGKVNNIGKTVSTWGPGPTNGIFDIDLYSPLINSIIGFVDMKEIIKEPVTAQWIQEKRKSPEDKVKWKWLKADGKYACSEWIEVLGEWYYINSSEYAVDGEWIMDDNNWYYLDPGSCKMHTGWLYVNNYWYYLEPNKGGPKGSMKTGWLSYKGDTYYLEPRTGYNKGHMYANGVFTIDGVGYRFDADGKLI